MAQQVLEGTWEQVQEQMHLRDKQFVGRHVRLTIDTIAERQDPPPRNESLLATLEKVRKLQAGMGETSGEDTQRYLREARNGGMYGLEPIDPVE